jgi:hypothetical protein
MSCNIKDGEIEHVRDDPSQRRKRASVARGFSNSVEMLLSIILNHPLTSDLLWG